MPSQFAWVDFSEEDRRRVSEVIQLFNEQETRDELGIGVVRDSLAETLFPGTSTIQTRARYFLFVPWIYLSCERKQTSAAKVSEIARGVEISLIRKLAESDDTDGIIGIDAQERLRRLPSNIYWVGLGTWGIRRFQGSQEQYHRTFDFWSQKRVAPVKNDDNEVSDEGPQVAWDPYIPKGPKEFPGQASFALNRLEAEYLQGRVQAASRKTTLLSHLLTLSSVPQDGLSFWEIAGVDSFPSPLPKQILHSRNFSLAMHGAAWLYNLLLAQKCGNQDWIERYQDEFDVWAEEIEKNRRLLENWDRQEFWSLVDSDAVQVGERTRRFINGWLDLALARNPGTLSSSKEARGHIENREHEIKRGRARLVNQSFLERWNGDAGAGTGRLEYRWFRVKRIAQDIIEGLQRGE